MKEILQFLTKFKKTNIFNKHRRCFRSNSSTKNVICQIFNQIFEVTQMFLNYYTRHIMQWKKI